MPKNSAIQTLDSRNLALAIIQALQMWSDERYRIFLHGGNSTLTREWFRWFVGEWNVARTIRDGKLDEVRIYLDQDFRRAVTDGAGGEAIDTAALHIKKLEWSAKLGKKKNPALPISLVSKVGFFLRPSGFVPLDRFSIIGLNQLHRTTGIPNLQGPTYEQYLEAFNKQLDSISSQIEANLNASWVSGLAKRLGCLSGTLKTKALSRKVFDNYLMHSGGYLKNQPERSAS